MARRIIEVDGRQWSVSPSGRPTQYGRDEFGIVFRALDDGEQRICRYSPLAAKSQDLALANLEQARLVELFRRSQPAWTSPELGYGSGR